ncbi:MAG: hypothetical protein GF313_01825 [Caldithrix sp.]|nr:hypothetical protein [Caldithrix sp.]
MKSWLRYIFIILSGLLLIYCIYKIPNFFIEPDIYKNLDFQDISSIENDYRKLFLQFLGGIIILYGLYLTYRRIKALENNVIIATESQITERFSKAIEHLGSEKLEIRLGGIYALERIARDSLKDHFSIMEILTSFVRENAKLEEKEKLRPLKEKTQQEQIDDSLDFRTIKPRTDIEAVLTVIGRRNWIKEETEKDFKLDLGMTNLEGIYLGKGNFENTLFWQANLRTANLNEAKFSGSLLMRANLERSFVYNTDFTNCNMQSSNLLHCINLSIDQLLKVETLHMAKLDEDLKEKLEELKPELLNDN